MKLEASECVRGSRYGRAKVGVKVSVLSAGHCRSDDASAMSQSKATCDDTPVSGEVSNLHGASLGVT